MKFVVDQQVVAHSIRRDSTNVGILRKIKETTTQVQMIGETMEDNCLVQITFGTLPNSYKSFIQGVISHDEMMTFDKFSKKFLLEE